jgi:hypothetical protein
MVWKKSHIVLGAVLAGTLALTLVIVSVCLVVRATGRSAHAALFQGHIQEYLSITREQREQGEYLRGKVIVVNTGDKEVDCDVFFELPSELRAATPEEVGTIVRLKWGTKMVGMYVSGRGSEGAADAQTCEVTVIDKSIPAIVAWRSFQGDDPPMHFTGARTGPKPVKAVVDFITSLPRERSDEGKEPKGWVILFRSDDPSVWNTRAAGNKLAVPVRQAPSSTRFLRLKRMDTGDSLILPITRNDLGRETRPSPAEGCWWNGSGQEHFGARHLGLLQAPPAATNQPGSIGIAGHDFDWWTGSGFGHKISVNHRQVYCWQGKEIPKTVFEIAVTAGPLTAEENRSLVTAAPEEGPPPVGWTVLFRSDDPAIWNTESPGEPFAIPVHRAHSSVRYLRLKRMDTGEFLIVPITRRQLLRDDKPGPAAAAWWNGTGRFAWKARHLGIVQEPQPRPGQSGVIGLLNANDRTFTGSGFGWKTYADDGQHYCWQGKELPKTTFEIAVTTGPLTGEEQAALAAALPPAAPELPPAEEGTPVPGAIGQPPPPLRVPGKRTIDLIRLIDPRKDTVRGRWLVVGSALHCNDQGDVPRIQIPYQPPAEYDFIVTFSQPQLRNGVSLIMPSPKGGSFFLLVGRHGGWGFELHGSKVEDLSGPMAANKAYTITMQVRQGGVKALLDGKVLVQLETDFHDLTADGYRTIPDKTLLGVACDDATVFHYVRVVEISGRGKKIR